MQMEEVEGLMDEEIEEENTNKCGFKNMVKGGAITSEEGPKMTSEEEPEYPTHKRYRVRKYFKERYPQFALLNTKAVTEDNMETESLGCSIDGSDMMGSDCAEAGHIDDINKNKPVTFFREILMNSVEEAGLEVEQEMGITVPEETREEIMEEVKNKVTDLGKNKKLNQYDVISVCREVYRRRK
jgi:hypothetical protein